MKTFPKMKSKSTIFPLKHIFLDPPCACSLKNAPTSLKHLCSLLVASRIFQNLVQKNFLHIFSKSFFSSGQHIFTALIMFWRLTNGGSSSKSKHAVIWRMYKKLCSAFNNYRHMSFSGSPNYSLRTSIRRRSTKTRFSI